MKETNISIYYFPPITQWCSISDVLFTGGRALSDFSVFKYYIFIQFIYGVNVYVLWLQPALQTCCSVLPPEIVMHDDVRSEN